MRQALNNNPKVQAGVIAVLIVLGILMFMKMSKKSDAGGAPAATSAAATAPATTGSGAGVEPAGSTAGTAVDPTATASAAVGGTPTALPSTPATAGTVSPEALVPGPGLPADVAQAFARGDAVVLLIVKDGATDDDLVRDSVAEISKPGVSVFVAPAHQIARYSRITQGVGVNRVPALIVIRPRKVGGNVPQGFISYGFRNKQSVVQAVEDALYEGRDDLPYYPG